MITKAQVDEWESQVVALRGELRKATEERDAAREALNEAIDWIRKFQDALVWCSGSDDFQTGGIAEEGWAKVCAPLLKEVGLV